jgi:hypothetical protein
MDETTSFIRDPDELTHRVEAYPRLTQEKRKELVLALKDLKDERAGKFLTTVLPGETEKEIQKLIRKQLFVLKTMGIKVEEPRASGESVLKAVEDKRERMGFLSNYDSEGARVVIAAFEIKKGYYIFVNAIAHLFDGLRDLKLVPLARQDLESILARHRSGADAHDVFLEISPRYATWLIEESDAISRHFAEDVRQLKRFVSTLKDNVQKPQDIYDFKAPDDVEQAPVSTVLLDDLFQPLTLTWDTMEADRKALAEIGGSSILLPPHMIEEKVEVFLGNLLDREPLKSKLPFMKRLLEDYAYMFFLSGRFDFFKTLMELLTSGKGPYGALSFFVVKALETKKQEPDRQGGLIVNPYEQIRR